MSDLEALFRSALSAQIPVSEALRGLSLYATVDLRSNPAYVVYKKGGAPSISIEPPDVAAGLERYLNEEVDSGELRDWATFIILTGAYDTPPPPSDDEDWYDDMWEVLNELSVPTLTGPITPANVRDKLRRIRRYGVGAA